MNITYLSPKDLREGVNANDKDISLQDFSLNFHTVENADLIIYDGFSFIKILKSNRKIITP